VSEGTAPAVGRRAVGISPSHWLLGAALCAVNGFVGWAAYTWAVLPFGSAFFLHIGFLWPFGLMAALLAIPLGVLACLRRTSRSLGLLVVPTSVVFIVSGLGAARLGQRHRMQRIAVVVRDAEPLVRAIEGYQRAHGVPPRRLEDLVPHQLTAVPSTGMGGYPLWRYYTRAEAHLFEGNEWVLEVNTGGPGINFDVLLYFPNGAYPATGYGGIIERVGSWAYVHE
jgi:hypothetical protein